MKKVSFFAFTACCLLLAPQAVRAQAFTGLGSGGNTLSVYSGPGATPTAYSVTNLANGDSLVGIDYFVSGTGQLYGMGSSGTLYTLAQSGATTYAATTVVANAVPGASVIDFNPVANRLRVYAGTSNFRLTPATGNTATADGTLAFNSGDTNFGTTPVLKGAAYINNYPGFSATSLYSVDASLDALVLNTGTPQFSGLTTVGTLTLNGTRVDFSTTATGFDIVTNGVNIAYVSNGNALYTVNLTNGVLTSLGTQLGPTITDFAFAVPEPGTYALIVLGGLGLAGYAIRRRQATAA